MLFYYGIFLIIALYSFLELYGLKRHDVLKLYVMLCFGLFAMSFLRWERGTDWTAYLTFFQSIPSNTWMPESNFEIGYTFLAGLTKSITTEYTVMLFFCAVIIFLFQSTAIWRLSPYPIFSLLFWFGINYAGVFFVRQTIAGAILLYSILFIRDRRFWPFVICLFSASLFHRSSIIFLLAYWVYQWRISAWVMILGVLVAIGLAGVADAIMQSFGSLVGGAIQMKIDAYTGELRGETFGLSQSMPIIIAKAFFSKLLLIVVALIVVKRIERKYPEFRGYLNLYWLGAVIFLMTITISAGLARLGYSFDILQIIILPYIIRSINGRPLRLFAILVSFAYIALRLYTVTTGGYYDLYVPYKTVFG